MLKAIVVIGILFCAASAFAQPDAATLASPFHAGLRSSYQRNYHRSDAQVVTGCPECGNFSNGTGSGYHAELFGEVPFNSFRRLNLTFGAGFTERGGAFGESVTGGLPILDPNSNQYVQLTRLNTYTASLKYIDLSAGLRLKPLSQFAGYITANFTAGLSLGHSTTYKQTETILSPQGVVYPQTNSTTLVDAEGAIDGVGTLYGLTSTIGYELPLGPMLTASPEISYYYPLNSVVSGFRWKVASISAGLAIRWNKPANFEGPPAPKPQAPVLAHEDPNLLAPKLDAVSLASAPFHIIETTVTETFPLLPYIFFDSASAAVPDRFAEITPEEAIKFRESELPHRSLESYYQILNVIGSRLRASETTTLTINGTTDGHEEPTLEASRELAKRRAESVSNYLRSIWGIPKERLLITTSDVPENPSSTEFTEGFEENRRVELSSNDDQLLRPLVHERFREETATPKELPLRLNASSSIGVREWHVTVLNHGDRIFETSGQGNPPPTIDWKPSDGQVESLAKSLRPNDSITMQLEAWSTNGTHSLKSIPLPASKSINPYELSRLSLIVFDFDQAAISMQNRRMITKFVGKSFYPSSTASITGSTDNLGELKHNQKLSEDRAFNVRDLILQEKPNVAITSTKGIGPSNLLYDNHLPEGRYYCRTVRVEVETPLESVLTGQK